ncbi:MAG: hypothetical protein FWB88_04800 [Defluviitaleaceae bacterium]|nr:hypothetical protein [Defluviitaleaceae bacterium]
MVAKQEKMSNAEWKKCFDKNNRPHNSNNGMLGFWKGFWTDETLKMFEDFSNELSDKFKLALTHINYTVMYGWKFSYSYSGFVLVKNVYIFDDCFGIDKIIVKSKADYQTALVYVASIYTDDFIRETKEKISIRNKKQAERSKRLMVRRKEELNKILESVEPEKLNRFRWSPCVSRESIKKLHNLDAKRIYDEELVDEVGYAMYARCLQGRDETLLNYNGKLLCHNCRKVHVSPANGIISCSCGHTYIFREYRKSFQKAKMPSGSATPFFNEFINKWERAKTYQDKMLSIDYVIHECHVNMISNVKRGFAGCNLIQGNKKQVSELILELAYK